MNESNKNNYIQIFENTLSKDICQQIIKDFELNRNSWKNGITGSGYDHFNKITKELSFDEGYLDKYNYLLHNVIRIYLLKYMKYLKLIYFDSDLHDKGFQLQKYIKNEGLFKNHTDNSIELTNKVDLSLSNIEVSNRIITFIFYLNDVQEGGETVFLNFKIKPKQGSLLLFPSTWTYPHRGEMPISNDKYIITGWIYNKVKLK